MSLFSVCPSLREHPLFLHADVSAIDACLPDAKLTVRDFAAGAEIVSVESEMCLGVLLTGTAAISSADGEKSVVLRMVHKTEMFGIASLFGNEREYRTHVVAQTACRVLFPDADAMRSLILREPHINEAFLRMMANRVMYLNRKIASFTAGSAERRLSLFLCENEREGVCVSPVSLSALAVSLDIGRASLYRAFDRLEADGFIHKQDKTVRVLDKEGMMKKYFGISGTE